MLKAEISAFLGSYMLLLKVFVVPRQEGLLVGCLTDIIYIIYTTIFSMHSTIDFKILEVWGPNAPVPERVYFNLP